MILMLKHLAFMDSKSVETVLQSLDNQIFLTVITKAIANKAPLPPGCEDDPSLFYESCVVEGIETYIQLFQGLRKFDSNEAHTLAFLFWVSRYNMLHPGGYEEIEEPFNSQHFFGYGISLPEDLIEYCTVNAPELMRYVIIADKALESLI